MSKLSTKARKGLSKSEFAVPSKAPGSGSYPIPDRSHAANALSRVSANGSPAEKAEVRAKVHAKYPDMGQSGLDKAMSDHADSIHPTKRS
jgi:hypothetical protein